MVHLQPEVVQHHPHIFSAAASIFAALVLVIAGLVIYTNVGSPPPPRCVRPGFGRLPLVRRRGRAAQRRAARA